MGQDAAAEEQGDVEKRVDSSVSQSVDTAPEAKQKANADGKNAGDTKKHPADEARKAAEAAEAAGEAEAAS